MALINKDYNAYWDWQTTITFYVAVHLINAHIVKKGSLHYRSHEDVNNAINPYGLSPCKLPEAEYSAYIFLQWMSKRSRYLISDNKNDRSVHAHFTKEKHFAKSIERLDLLLEYINKKYGIVFDRQSLDCCLLAGKKMTFFEHVPQPPIATVGQTL